MYTTVKKKHTLCPAVGGSWGLWQEAAHNSLSCFLVLLKDRIARVPTEEGQPG